MSRIYPYAGFWKRAVAFVIDSIVVSIPVSVVITPFVFFKIKGLVALSAQNSVSNQEALNVILGIYGLIFLTNLFFMIVFWLYHAVMESGVHQATLGKMAMGIKVVGANGERISFLRATGRTFGKYLSYIILYFGCYMAGFTKKRQALHDMMATTYVVNKEYQPGEDLPELPFSTGGLIASILVAFAPFILIFGSAFLMVMLAAVTETETDSSDYLDRMTLSLNTSIAEAQLHLLSVDENSQQQLPFTEEDITYTQTPQGLRAQFKGEDDTTYTLLLKDDARDVCCDATPQQCKLLHKPVCK